MRACLSVTMCLLICMASAQTHTMVAGKPAPPKKGILYSSSIAVGGQLYSDGWAIHTEWATINDWHHRSFYQIEISQLKHPKEVKQTSEYGTFGVDVPAPKPFVFGKQNSFYQISFSKGKEWMIGQRAAKSGVEVSLKGMIGVSLGIVKPYYLKLLYPGDANTDTVKDVRYNSRTASEFLDWTRIYGASSFGTGLTQVSFVPGIHLKAGLKFDWAFLDEYIKALEVGGVLDAYYKRIPIMVLQNNQRFFPNLYLGIQFGKKKT